MLNFIRKNSQSWVSKIILLLVIASFGIWGVGDMSSKQSQNIVIAKVGDHKIYKSDVENIIQAQLQRFQMSSLSLTPEILEQLGILQNSVQSLINEATMKEVIANLKFYLSDQTVMQDIIDDPMFQIGGKFSNKRLKAFLHQENLSEDALVNRQRFIMAQNQLIDTLSANTLTSSKTLEYLFLFNNEKRIADILEINAQHIPTDTPKKEELLTFYDEHKEKFISPEYRNISYFYISPDSADLKKQITPEDLQAFYDEYIDSFKQKEQRKLLSYNFTNFEDAQKAYETLKNTSTIPTINSGLDSATMNLNDLGWVAKEDMASFFATDVFSLSKNQFTKPLQAMDNWQIFYIMDIKPEKTLALSEVKQQILTEILLDRSYNLSDQVSNLIDDQMTLEDIAKKIQLPLQQTSFVSKQGVFESEKDALSDANAIIDMQEIISLGFETDVGETSFLMEGHNEGSFFIIRVDSLKEEKQKSFEQVENEVAALWTKNKQNEGAKALQDTVLQELQNNASITAIKQKYNVKHIRTVAFKRDGAGLEKEPLPYSLIQKIFDTEINTPVTNASGDQYFIAKAIDLQRPSLNDMEDEKETLQDDLVDAYQNELLHAFGVEQKSILQLEVNNEALKDFFRNK